MSNNIKEMRAYREKMNNIILKNKDSNIKNSTSNKLIKRFLNLDSRVYENGVLDKKIKELMGLVASIVFKM
jgi:hypothetical protein